MIPILTFLPFFFSSRRRHTRSLRDWSSDVCSSDLQLESGHVAPPGTRQLPLGYHRVESCTIVAAPVEAWRRPGSHRSWGVGTHLAALRSVRSRSLADLRDLESLCRWVREKGGDLVTVLPLLPTFNADPPDPSPYSPVSRLFWSELMLD